MPVRNCSYPSALHRLTIPLSEVSKGAKNLDRNTARPLLEKGEISESEASKSLDCWDAIQTMLSAFS